MKILLAIDDSEFGQEAIRALLAQVHREGTEIRVLHVVEPAFAYISEDTGILLIPSVAKIQEHRRKQAQELVHGAAEMLREAGFKTHEIVDEGDPRHKILDCAAEWDADLIVVGSHGRTVLGRFLMGSVSEAVTRHAKCSVQVVRIKDGMGKSATRSEP